MLSPVWRHACTCTQARDASACMAFIHDCTHHNLLSSSYTHTTHTHVKPCPLPGFLFSRFYPSFDCDTLLPSTLQIHPWLFTHRAEALDLPQAIWPVHDEYTYRLSIYQEDFEVGHCPFFLFRKCFLPFQASLSEVILVLTISAIIMTT